MDIREKENDPEKKKKAGREQRPKGQVPTEEKRKEVVRERKDGMKTGGDRKWEPGGHGSGGAFGVKEKW